MECAFVQNTTTRVVATNVTETGIACLTPTGYQSGTNDTFVYIAVNGNKYTDSLPFEFYGTWQPELMFLKSASNAMFIRLHASERQLSRVLVSVTTNVQMVCNWLVWLLVSI